MVINKEKLKEEALAFIDSLDDVITFELGCNVDDITCLGDKWRELKPSPICEMRIKGLKGLNKWKKL